MTAPIIFKGIKFPFRRGSTSFPEAVEDDDLIKDSLLQLVLTMNGERVMRPDFGSNALSFVFENNDVVLGNLIRSEIAGVIAKFEPRVQVRDIRVERRVSSIILTISYVIIARRVASSVTVTLPGGTS
jgi:phage baseplate assembly protein W